MAITIEANYAKKIGLPGYSSHQYSVTVRTEVSDVSQVDQESRRLYALLQASVDREIQETGFSPEPAPKSAPNGQTNGYRNGGSRNGNGNGYDRTPYRSDSSEAWLCSEKQRDLIKRIIEENSLENTEIEELARQRFNLPVCRLNKLQASGLIEELFAQYSGKRYQGNNRGRGDYRRSYQNGGARA